MTKDDRDEMQRKIAEFDRLTKAADVLGARGAEATYVLGRLKKFAGLICLDGYGAGDRDPVFTFEIDRDIALDAVQRQADRVGIQQTALFDQRREL